MFTQRWTSDRIHVVEAGGDTDDQRGRGRCRIGRNAGCVLPASPGPGSGCPSERIEGLTDASDRPGPR